MKTLIIFFCFICFKLSAGSAVNQMQMINLQASASLKPVLSPTEYLNNQKKINTDLKFINSRLDQLRKNPKEYLKVLNQMNSVLKEKVKLLSSSHAGMPPEEYLKYLRKMNSYLKERQQKLIASNPNLALSTSFENSGTAVNSQAKIEVISDNTDEVGKNLWKIARQRTLIGNMGDPGTESTKSDFKFSKQKQIISDVGSEVTSGDFNTSKKSKRGSSVLNADGNLALSSDLKQLKRG